jgi:type IV pilus assembly protein PilN
MRLDINLASQPYEDARQFWLRWGTAAGAVGVLTLVLLAMTIMGWIHARQDHIVMAERRAKIADRDRIRANAEDFLNRPENRNTRDTSQFLNELIERKAFSWTLVLENLEKVMPPRVHLVSIQPTLDEDNQLALKMLVAGDSRDRAIELPRRMEGSGRFAQTSIVSEHYVERSTNGDTEQFEIAAIYIPEPLAEPGESKAAGAPKAGVAPNTDANPPSDAKPDNAKPKRATPRLAAPMRRRS